MQERDEAGGEKVEGEESEEGREVEDEERLEVSTGVGLGTGSLTYVGVLRRADVQMIIGD